MLLAPFVASFLLALTISVVLTWLFTKPIEDFLERFIIDPMICTAWSKYIRFAVVAVGISTGTQTASLEEHLSSPAVNKAAVARQVTEAFWALELYRTLVGTLVGLAWLLLAFCVLIVIARMFIKPLPTNQTRAIAEAERVQGSTIANANRH
jgi:hypothetical protein